MAASYNEISKRAHFKLPVKSEIICQNVLRVWKYTKRADFFLFPEGGLVAFEILLLITVNMREQLHQNSRGTTTLDLFGGGEFLKLITFFGIDANKYVRIKVKCVSCGNFH